MKDSCSSEEEIVKRRRFRSTQRDLRSLFDEEKPVESSEEENVDERSTLFNEIFGTGKEYLYILEEEEEDEESVVEEERELSASDCKRYVIWNLDVEFKGLERFVGLLLEGYSLQFVMLHDKGYDVDIYTGMRIEETVKGYKEFVEYKAKYKGGYVEDVYSWEGLKYIPKYEEVRKGYKSYGVVKYLLTVEQFETNLKDREVVFVPCSFNEECNEFNEEEYVHQLSTSIVVRDYLVQMKKLYGEVPEEKVSRFFLPPEEEYNEKRREILRRVVSNVQDVQHIQDDTAPFFNKIVDRIFNGSLRRLSSEEKVVSCTREGGMIKGVVLDHRGFILEKFKKSKGDMEAFMDETKPYAILLSGFSPSIRLVMQSLIGRNCLYVDNSLFKGEKDKYEFCARIGRLALCPEMEYIRLYLSGGLSSLGNNNTVRKAILTAISITGLDLNLLLSQPDKVSLLSFLGGDSISRIFTQESYTSLGVLQEMISSKVALENLLTYLRLFKEYSTLEEPLDETPVHPNNYHFLKSDENTLENTSEDTNEFVRRLRDSITYSFRPEFSGFPDSVAFENLSGSYPGILGSTLEGRVFYVGDGYILVSVLNNVTVFVRTQDQHFPNQMVRVRILEANEAFVSFNGEILPEDTPRLKYPRFCKHPLYREMDSKASEEYLRDSQDLILLRRSSRDNSPIIVFSFYPGIYVHYKLQPKDTSFIFRGKAYSSIDEAISLLVKPVLRRVQEISRHRHFYPSEEDVDLSGDSSFIRYAFFFPKEYPGRLCFIFKSQGVEVKEYLGVYDTLSYKGHSFESLEDFLLYRKRA